MLFHPSSTRRQFGIDRNGAQGSKLPSIVDQDKVSTCSRSPPARNSEHGVRDVPAARHPLATHTPSRARSFVAAPSTASIQSCDISFLTIPCPYGIDGTTLTPPSCNRHCSASTKCSHPGSHCKHAARPIHIHDHTHTGAPMHEWMPMVTTQRCGEKSGSLNPRPRAYYLFIYYMDAGVMRRICLLY